MEILREIAREDETILEGELAFIENLASSSIALRLVCYTTRAAWSDYVQEKSVVIRKIIHRYREEGIEFAFPSTSIYMAKE